MVKKSGDMQGERDRVSPGDFLDWKRETSAFQSLSAWTGGSFDRSGSGAIAQEVALCTATGGTPSMTKRVGLCLV